MGYLFYGFYKAVQVFGKNKDSEFRAWYLFSIIQLINLYSFAQIFILIFYQREFIIPSYYLPVAPVLIIVINYFLFLRKDKNKSIIEKYKNEYKVQNITINVVTHLYIIGSFALFFYSKISIDLIKFTN
jgi:hypothetical protein